MSRYRSRKFLLALLTLISATLLIYLGHISDGVYSAVVIANLGGYMTSNVMQKRIVQPDEATP